MKSIFIPIILIILPFSLIKEVSALNSYCWNPNTGELNAQMYTNEYGCGPETCLDDDGITPYCVNKQLGGTITYKGETTGSYGMGELQNLNGFYAKTGYSDVTFNFNLPVWREAIMKSITISSKGNDGTTQWHDGYVPMSYDYCSNMNIIQNQGNFRNMYFDGYDELPISEVDLSYANGVCYRVYIRMKVRMFYLLPNQVNAVPVVESSYYYLSTVGNTFMQFYNPIETRTPRIAINNLQYYTQKDYYSILDNINYRNYNNNIQDMLVEFNESQNTYIKDIKDAILSTESADTSGLNGSVGWLPAGPVDSLLNLPLSMLTNLSNSLGGTCQSVNLPLPFVDKDLPLPCLNNIYNQIDGLSVFLNTTGIIVSAFILYKYLLNLYKWVDDTLTFRENNMLDNWGGL